MKKLVGLILLAAVALAAHNPMWVRVYYSDAALAEQDIVANGMDVVSGSAAEKYYDIIAPADVVSGLQEKGYRVKVLAADANAPLAALPPDLGLYHTYAEMLTELQGYAATYPGICTLTDVGNTWENRDLWCLKISDNPGTSENEPKLYVCGNHHARELMTVEIPLHFIKTLLEGYATNTDYQFYINNYEMYFIPMVNPDGHVYVEGHSSGSASYWWRKNRRVNTGGSYGVDPNRNYSYKWGYDNSGSSGNPSSDTYRGPSAFSEPETDAIRDLMVDVEFDYGLDYHSYGEYILIPYHYDTVTNAPNPERPFFVSCANGMNVSLGNRYAIGTAIETVGYRVNGGAVDYAYGEITEKPKLYLWSFEVNTYAQGGFAPPDTLIAATVAEQLGPLMWLLEYMRDDVGITLTGFHARPQGERAVISWETAREDNHAGFNLYRAELQREGRERLKLNGALITGRSPYKFVDDDVAAGGDYDYYLEDVDLNGRATVHGPVHLEMGGVAKGAFGLAQNAPNPAHSTTSIKFSLPAAGDARLSIYDLAGRRISTFDLAKCAAGPNDVAVDVSTLAAGVYVYRLEAGDFSAARKMVVTK